MTSLSTALFIDVDKQKAVRAQLEQIRDRNDKIRMLWQFFLSTARLALNLGYMESPCPKISLIIDVFK